MAFYWHVHHDVLAEWCYSYEERAAYIKAYKPAFEVSLRLRLLQPVKGQLPPAVIKAGAAYEEAQAVYEKVGAAYEEAQAAYEEAKAAYEKAKAAYEEAKAAYEEAIYEHREEIEALHTSECPGCPWDGMTIFPAQG